jgi:hypothetical protein
MKSKMIDPIINHIMDNVILPWKPKRENQLRMFAQFSFRQSPVTMQFMALHASYPLLANKNIFESESIGTNRESWINGKAKGHDLSFPIHQSLILSYSICFNQFTVFFTFCLIPLLHLHCI